ncbi:hypothetical protein PABG_04083 [Paracoccidioides brasiliensis Pb03]|nr:hypothetical protein PABG_04083 [Paracoccidioides brasiliensis Pb03]
MNMQASSVMDIPDLSTAPLTACSQVRRNCISRSQRRALQRPLPPPDRPCQRSERARYKGHNPPGAHAEFIGERVIAESRGKRMNASITSAIVKALDRKRLGLAHLDEGEVQDRYGERGERSSVLTSDGGWEVGMVDSNWDGERGIQVTVGKMHDYLRERYENATWTRIEDGLRQFLYGKVLEEKYRRVVKILTLSSSATVMNALLTVWETENKENRSGGLHIQLKMMQSRPLCGGVDVAVLEPDVDVVMIVADRINI